MTTPKKEAPTAAVATSKPETQVEFVPHGASDKIKLTIAMVKAFIAVPTKTKKYPSDADCIKFIALCQAKKLNPFEGDAYMIGYDTQDGPKFNLITAHQAFLKRAELNNEYDGMESGLIIERDDKVIEIEGDFHLGDDILLGGWAKVYCKNRSKPMVKRLRLSRFNKGVSVWKEDPAGMICKCAEADALRSTFPTLMGGMYMREELPEPSTTTAMSAPIFTSPKEPEKTPEAKPLTANEKLLVLCEESGIAEEDLMDCLGNMEIADGDHTKIEHLSDKAAQEAVERWDDISSHIKEVLSQQG